VGAIEVLDELGSDNKLFCPPQSISNLEQVRVIVTYIEALPKRMTDGFGLLANEAMAKAWPCKT
jgi:Rap1a immunity proteins